MGHHQNCVRALIPRLFTLDGEVAGTIRITPPVPRAPWPIAEEFPKEIAAIAEAYAAQGQTLWESSRVMIVPKHQKTPHLLVGLLGCLHRYGQAHGIAGYVWGCTPEHGRMYEAIGARCVAGPKPHSQLPTAAVAMHWRLAETTPRFSRTFGAADITLDDAPPHR